MVYLNIFNDFSQKSTCKLSMVIYLPSSSNVIPSIWSKSDIPFIQTFYSLQKDHMRIQEVGIARQDSIVYLTILVYMSTNTDIPV